MVGHWEATWGGFLGKEDEEFYDTSNTTETQTSPNGDGLHFYADGTFKFVFGSTVYGQATGAYGARPILMLGVTIWRGNYRAENGNLYLSNIKYSYTPKNNDPSHIEAYQDRSAPDKVYQYEFGNDYYRTDKGYAYIQLNISRDITEDIAHEEKFYDMADVASKK